MTTPPTRDQPPRPTRQVPLARAPSSLTGAALTLIDAKRANNLCIILARLKKSFDEIRAAVVNLDADVLSQEDVASLLK